MSRACLKLHAAGLNGIVMERPESGALLIRGGRIAASRGETMEAPL
jgi:hypothetical protein